VTERQPPAVVGGVFEGGNSSAVSKSASDRANGRIPETPSDARSLSELIGRDVNASEARRDIANCRTRDRTGRRARFFGSPWDAARSHSRKTDAVPPQSAPEMASVILKLSK